MDWAWWYTVWTTGTATVSVDMNLDPDLDYLVTGGLTQTEGGDHAHVYISMVCHQAASDEIDCGLRDDDGDAGLNLVEPLSGAASLTVKLLTKGGAHRAEGVVFQV